MNLRLRHFPIVLLGIAVGAGAGWLISFWIKPGSMPEFERAVGLREGVLVVGGVLGAAVAVLVLLVRSVRDPAAEPPRNFTSINGTGSTLIGKRDVRPDGSYATTEWLIVLFVPVVPICRYRVTELGSQAYTIHEKRAPRAGEVIGTYLMVAAIGAAVAAIFMTKSVPLALIAIGVGVVVAVRQRMKQRTAGMIYTKNFCRACGARRVESPGEPCPQCGRATV